MMQTDRSSHNRTPIDAISAVLFLIILFLPGLSLRSADWTDHLGFATTLGLFGTLAGIALARSIFSGSTAVVFSSIYFVFACGSLLGTTLDPTLIWRDRILDLLGRLGVFVETIFQGERNQDSLMFVFLMGILFWFMGSWGTWNLFRRRGLWGTVIPPGITLVVNQIFYLGSTSLDGYIIVYAFMILLLTSRVDLWRREQLWKTLRAQVAPGTILLFSRAAAILAVIIVLVAWGGPAFAQSEQAANLWGVITVPFEEIRNTLSDALGGLRGSIGVHPDAYGASLRLQAGAQPADVVIMQVAINQRPANGGRFYWYSRAYNIYEEGTWTISVGDSVTFNPEEGDLPLPAYASRQIVQVVVAPKTPSIRGLYIPDQPVWANRSGQADLLRMADGTVDVIRISAGVGVRNGETYLARGSIAVPSADELRQASQTYPDWMVDNFLQLPTNITPRTLELAESITEGLDNPFDKAAAITRWLRDNIEYQRVTIPAPQGVEEIDWFLFDYKTGFCNWYASAEVILLRLLGIPSRMAVGYARGTFNASEGYYEVRGEDAHAWPEVFFPGYGWVEFEPTVNQSALTRPEGLEPADDSAGGGGNGDSFEVDPLDRLEEITALDDVAPGGAGLSSQPDLRSIATWLVTIVGALILILLIWVRYDPVIRMTALSRVISGLERIGIPTPQVLQNAYPHELTQTGALYSRWSVWLKRLGVPVNLHQTPNERAGEFGGKYPQAASMGWKIVDTYVAERFGGVSVIADEIKDVWGDLRAFMLLQWFRKVTGRQD